jgi:hypothetical protein
MKHDEATVQPAPLGQVERGVGRLCPKRATLTKRQKRMQKAIEYMSRYMAEYHKQQCCLDYSDETFIDDVLYGLGVALHGTPCTYAQGYETWKRKLRAHLKPPNVQLTGDPGTGASGSAAG